MRISDWSSDVCSSNLLCQPPRRGRVVAALVGAGGGRDRDDRSCPQRVSQRAAARAVAQAAGAVSEHDRAQHGIARDPRRGVSHRELRLDRKGVVLGKRGALLVNTGWRRYINKKKKN